MIYDKNHKDFLQVKLVDCNNHEIPHLISYDTKTFEAELVLMGTNNRIIMSSDEGEPKALVIKTIIPGSRIVKKGTKVWKSTF